MVGYKSLLRYYIIYEHIMYFGVGQIKLQSKLKGKGMRIFVKPIEGRRLFRYDFIGNNGNALLYSNIVYILYLKKYNVNLSIIMISIFFCDSQQASYTCVFRMFQKKNIKNLPSILRPKAIRFRYLLSTTMSIVGQFKLVKRRKQYL